MSISKEKPDPILIQQIGQLAIHAKDLDESVLFYRDILRLPLLARLETPGLAFFQCGEVRLMLSVPSSVELQQHSSIIYFQVDDLEATFTALQAARTPIVREPRLMGRMANRETWMAFFRDPADNLLALMCERPIPPE